MYRVLGSVGFEFRSRQIREDIWDRRIGIRYMGSIGVALGALSEHARRGGSAAKYLAVDCSGTLEVGHSAGVQPTLAGNREHVVDRDLQRGPTNDVALASTTGATEWPKRHGIDRNPVWRIGATRKTLEDKRRIY
jgi:hypothetical protein